MELLIRIFDNVYFLRMLALLHQVTLKDWFCQASSSLTGLHNPNEFQFKKVYFFELRREKEMENETLMVSACITSYYHEAYISHAISSVLAQNVNFNYEIVISDDCSKDGTQEIIKKFAEKFPCIRYKFNEKNIGLTKNVFQARCMAKGKYIIPLSGDDYWIDNNKLQKQVDFLEKHPEYIGVATRIEMRKENSKTAEFIDPPLDRCDRTFTLRDFLGGKNFPMNGFLMRNLLKEKYELFSLMPKMSPYIDDLTDCILILMLGNIYIMSDATVAYRRSIGQEGLHNFNSINRGMDKVKKEIDLLNKLYSKFGKKIDLFERYKMTLGPEIAKNYRAGTAKKFRKIINTIPVEYRKRGIVVHSVLYIIPKTIEVIRRKIRI